MEQGKSPIGKDGKPVELHHEGQKPTGNVKEMTRTEHRLGNNYKKNHPNANSEPSKINRKKFKRERETYWKEKVKEKK